MHWTVLITSRPHVATATLSSMTRRAVPSRSTSKGFRDSVSKRGGSTREAETNKPRVSLPIQAHTTSRLPPRGSGATGYWFWTTRLRTILRRSMDSDPSTTRKANPTGLERIALGLRLRPRLLAACYLARGGSHFTRADSDQRTFL